MMQNSNNKASDIVSEDLSNGHYTVIVTDTTDTADPDEFVLDVSSLPCEADYAFDTSSCNSKTLECYDSGTCTDILAKGTKRKLQIEDISEVNISDEARSDGYESDSEVDDDDMALGGRKKKIRCGTYTGPLKSLSHGEKRKFTEEEDGNIRRKRMKASSPGEYYNQSSSDSSSSCSSSDSSSSSSDSSSDSSSCSSTDSDGSSDCSSSDNDTLDQEMPYNYLNSTERVPKCPVSCVCKVGQSQPPIPIERSSRSIQPLYKKLLQRRLLSMANTFSNTCCNRQCYTNWVRNRISLNRMVRDYGKSDLRVDHFSWGQWKQTPEVDEDSSSEEEWFW